MKRATIERLNALLIEFGRGSNKFARWRLIVVNAVYAAALCWVPADALTHRSLFVEALGAQPPSRWALVFALAALLLLWRLVDHKPRRVIAVLVNAGICGLWVGWTAGAIEGLGYIGPTIVLYAVIVADSVVNLLRTDLTIEDRWSA